MYLRVLQYLYTGDYEDELSSLLTNDSRLYSSIRAVNSTNLLEQIITSCLKTLKFIFLPMNSF